MAFRSLAVLSTLLSAALAQSSSNPLIPSGISSNCTAYLASFDAEASFSVCTAPFTTALQAFAPSSNTTSLSSSTIRTALDTLCATNASSACPQSTVTTQLSAFYAACPAELTSAPNQAVKLLYDVLYTLLPLTQAVCAKDDNGTYCATELANSSSAGTIALVDPNSSQPQSVLSQYLYTTPGSTGAAARRDLSNATTAFVPNATTYANSNLMFLFRQASMTNTELCTTCTRNILTSYISFESSCPYAPGINNSLLLSGQMPLYNNITSKCGASFLNGAVSAAGSLSNNLMSGAAPRAGGQDLSVVLGAILGTAAFLAASM